MAHAQMVNDVTKLKPDNGSAFVSKINTAQAKTKLAKTTAVSLHLIRADVDLIKIAPQDRSANKVNAIPNPEDAIQIAIAPTVKAASSKSV
jgi:hypothetical protein